MTIKKTFAAIALATAATATSLGMAAAQGSYPERPITIYVPFSAGGGADPVARSVAQGLQDALGQPVIVEFRPGANGTIGARLVAEAAPDGYTLLVTSPAPLVNVRFSADTPYDAETAFAPIAQIADAPYLVVASARSGFDTFEDFVAYARANPGVVNMGTSSLGGLSHLTMTILADAIGADITPIPYGGVGDRLADLMAGNIDATQGIGASGFLSGIDDGSIIPLAVMGDTRLHELPDTPTTAELGHPNARSSGYYVLAAPAGTPDEIMQLLNETMVAHLTKEETQEAFIRFGNMVKTGTIEEAIEVIEADAAQLADLIERGVFALP